MSKRRYWFGFIFILFLAIFLRFYKLGQIPVSLYWDEAAILLDAKIVSRTGHDMHNNSLVLFDRFTLENANMVIFGKAGGGKSYAIKLKS